MKEKKSNAPPLPNSFSLLMGLLFIWLLSATNQKVIFQLASSPAAVCSMTDNPSGFAPSLVPADGTAVLMALSGVLETAHGRGGRERGRERGLAECE